MRVLHVTDTFLPKIGGMEIALDQLVRAMNALGHKCVLLAKKPRSMGSEIDVPYPLRRFSRPRASLWAGWRIMRHIRATEAVFGPFDVFIGHHSFAPGYACVMHGLRTGRPSVVYPRGGDIYEGSRFRNKRAVWHKVRWTLSNASAVACASAAMEQLVLPIIGPSAAHERLVRIPNGVDFNALRIDAGSSRFAGDARFASAFVLALGRLIARKGFNLLITAFLQLSRSGHAHGWRLIIAGDGKEREALRRQAASLGDTVIFTGFVEGADKRWLLQHCRFMVVPSLEESFGNVALEAMACGKPVIASRMGGLAEVVQDGHNGRLVEVGQVESLAVALADFMQRDLSVASEAATHTVEAFSWKKIAAQYGQLLQRLTKDHNSANSRLRQPLRLS